MADTDVNKNEEVKQNKYNNVEVSNEGYDDPNVNNQVYDDPNEEQIVQVCCPNVNRDLLINKLWYFFFFGANGSLMPYLILFFKQLGLKPSQVGIVSGLKPFISFVCSPFWGYVADKSGKTKFIYVISLLAYGGGYMAYSLAPSKHVCSFTTNASSAHQETYKTHIHKRRTRVESQDAIYDLYTGGVRKTTQLGSRVKRDFLGLDSYFRRKLVPVTEHRVKRLPMYTNIRNKSVPLKRKMKNYGHIYQTLYPEESGVSFFQIPASLQILTLAEEKSVPEEKYANETFLERNVVKDEGEKKVNSSGSTWAAAVHSRNSPWTVCAAARGNAMENIALAARERSPSNLTSIFTYLLIVTLIATVFSCPLITIVDTATIRKLKETNETHKYGKQRLWGSFAWGLSSFSIGAILSLLPLCGTLNNEVNYYPAFYIFAAFLAIALFVGLKLKFSDGASTKDDELHVQAPVPCNRTEKIVEGLKMLKEPTYCYFIMTSFYIGMVMSIIKTFLFWHLKDLGAPQILFSIIAAVNCCAEVFVYYFSSLFIKRVGHIRVLYIALICYSLRLFYYGLLKRPWYVLAAEPLSGITTAAAWATMTSYVGLNANPESVTTMQGILHGVHWGLGHGCGELLGGFMVSWVGAAMTFNMFGIATIFELALFVLVNSISGRRRRAQSEDNEIGIKDEVTVKDIVEAKKEENRLP